MSSKSKAVVPPPPPGAPEWAASLPLWLRTGQCAALCGEGSKTILDRIRSGHLRARLTPSGYYLVERDSLLAYLAGDANNAAKA